MHGTWREWHKAYLKAKKELVLQGISVNDEIVVTWKNDLVYNDLKLANQILKVAEQKIEYFNCKH